MPSKRLIRIGPIGHYRTEDEYDTPFLCPRCGDMLPLDRPGALSRRDNETEICPTCGTKEALIDMMGKTKHDTIDTWFITLEEFYNGD